MTYFIKRFALLLIAIITVSCSKDDDGRTQNSSTPRLISFTKNEDTYQISYDSDNNPQALISPTNTITSIIYTENKLTSFWNDSYTYDSEGRLKTITNSDGTCSLIYNIQNLLIRQDITINNSLNGNSTLTIQRNLVYNDNHQLIEVTETTNNNSNIEKYTLTYNQVGQVVRVVNSFSNTTNSFNIVRDDMDIIYHTSKNPLYELYKKMGLHDNITFIEMPQLEASNSSNISIGNYAYFRIYYISENSPSNIDITSYSNNSSLTTTQQYNYLTENNYPIAADLTVTYSNSSGTIPLNWEYNNL